MKIDEVREGRTQKISILDIVVEDIVALNVGDQISADGESSMIGESEQIDVKDVSNRFSMSIAKVRKIVLTIAFVALVVMLVCYLTRNTEEENSRREFDRKHKGVIEILVLVAVIFWAVVTFVVVAIHEGLPLAVTLTLAYSMKRMIGDQAMFLILTDCESSATRTLTMNQMAVTKFLLGLEYMEPHSSNVIAPQVLELLHQGVGFNTMSMLSRHGSRLLPEYSGSPTDKAILSWAIEELDMDMEKLKQRWIVLHAKTFNLEKKRSGVSIRRKSDNAIHVHWKGDAEMILPTCLEYYNSNGCKKILDSDSRKQLENIIEGMAASGLRCIAFGHKNVLEGMECKKLTEEGLTLLGIVGLKDPCRPECEILESGQEELEEEVMEGIQFGDFITGESSDIVV